MRSMVDSSTWEEWGEGMFDRLRVRIVMLGCMGVVGLSLLFALAGFGSAPSSHGITNPVPSLAGIEPALVPTLGQWGLLLLALAMMGVAFWVIRRNSAS